MNISQLAGRTVVIDTYIYIYKYLGEDRMIEHMNALITNLLAHNITPIFVFDGKPPQEKQTLLQQRRMQKKDAEDKYNEILHQLEMGIEHSREFESQLACLKKQFLRVDHDHIQCVKMIMKHHKVEYVDAEGESDKLCVEYVKSHRAWACMSDDMDMFAYGCPRVVREYCLSRNTVTLYTLKDILTDLKMTMKHFREILVLSGTDYNLDESVTLNESIKWFNEYRKYCAKHRTNSMEFYDWLRRYTKYVKDYAKLVHVHNMFIV